MKKLVLVCLLLAGCSTTGEFVKSITPQGDGIVKIESCRVHHNPWGLFGQLSESDCKTDMIRVR